MANAEQRMRELREYREKLAADKLITHKPFDARVTKMLQPLSDDEARHHMFAVPRRGLYNPFHDNNERKAQGMSWSREPSTFGKAP